MHLTDLSIKSLPLTTSGQTTYRDDAVKGFGVRVGKHTKTFFVMYGHDRKVKTLGRYPSVTLKKARSEAQKVIATHTPSKTVPSLSEARDLYYADCEARLRPGTVDGYRLHLNRLTEDKLIDITRASVLQDAHAIMATKIFLNWCIKNDWLDKNPFRNDTVTYGERERVLTLDEIKKVWNYERPPYSDYIKVLLLTGQRRGQFQDFDIRGDDLFFPARIMKGKKDHAIPLLPLARKYVERLSYFNGWSKAKVRIDKHTKVSDWVLHDLRRSFSTIQAQLGTPIHVTETILSHTSGSISGVARIYNRYSYLEEARLALEKYEDWLQTVVA